MRKLLDTLFPVSTRRAAARAAATYVQAFAGILVAAWVDSPALPKISAIVDVVEANADFAAGSALLATIGSLGWNSWLQRRQVGE